MLVIRFGRIALAKSFAWQSQFNLLIVSGQYIAEIMHLLISSVTDVGGAKGQEVILLTAEDFIASLDIDRCPDKRELSMLCHCNSLIAFETNTEH